MRHLVASPNMAPLHASLNSIRVAVVFNVLLALSNADGTQFPPSTLSNSSVIYYISGANECHKFVQISSSESLSPSDLYNILHSIIHLYSATHTITIPKCEQRDGYSGRCIKTAVPFAVLCLLLAVFIWLSGLIPSIQVFLFLSSILSSLASYSQLSEIQPKF